MHILERQGKIKGTLFLIVLSTYFLCLPSQADADSLAPQILDHSITNLHVYHGDILRVEVTATGDNLRYQWSWVSGEGEYRRFVRVCNKRKCVINTKIWPLNSHTVELAVSNDHGAVFLDFNVTVAPRPSYEILPRDITADHQSADREKLRNVSAQGIRDKVQDGSRFSQSLHQFLLGKDFSAKSGFTYSTWNEPNHREQAKDFLTRLSDRQILETSVYAGLEIDTNILRRSDYSDIEELTDIKGSQRQAVMSDAKIKVNVFKQKKHRLYLFLEDERRTQIKPLNLIGVSETKPIEALNSIEQRYGFRYQMGNEDENNPSALTTGIEPYLRTFSLNENRIETARGLTLDAMSRTFQSMPALKLTYERRVDANSLTPSIIHPQIRELNLIAADLGGSYRELDLSMVPVDTYNRSIRAFWNIAKLEHLQSEAFRFNYNQQAFGLRAYYAANIRNSFATDIAMISRFFYDDPQARLDRQAIAAIEWLSFANPYISRIFRLDFERSQSSIEDLSYTRFIFTMSGEFRY
ncbi:MAG: hypothetical protein ACOH5I_15435 [Oligoflexus sp.]